MKNPTFVTNNYRGFEIKTMMDETSLSFSIAYKNGIEIFKTMAKANERKCSYEKIISLIDKSK